MPHHVTQRGNRQADVFIDAEDRRKYLSSLDNFTRKYGLEVLAYCLMTNHVHLVVVPVAANSLGNSLRDTHTIYAAHMNRKEGFTGHLWQGRFFSCVLDDTHLWTAVRYVERNPLRAGMVARAEDYPWSSAGPHCGLRNDPILSRNFPPAGFIADWREWLADQDDAEVKVIRQNTHTGRPCGGKTFIEKLENMLGRVLSPAKRGPKRRSAEPKKGTDY
jgi:putative transposase